MKKPKPTDNEVAWSKYLAWKLGGQPEVRHFTGLRCDIITEEFSIEVEWIKKYKEAIGQAVIYSALFNRKPKIILLTRGKASEEKYYLTCLVACYKLGIELDIYPTFERN